MKIVVDQNIPLANEFFGDLGDVIALPGRDIKPEDIIDTDILLVRSITQVNEELLAGSRVKFVGSCTIGIDHIDTDYLESNNIVWANAPGCNANAVVQYVFSAMALLRPQWQEQRVGIVGCGNIGSRLYNRLKKLGVDVVVYDPFLSKGRCHDLVSFEELLGADIISCHTPLTHKGEFPTYHLFGEDELSCLASDSLLINSGRGAVIDNNALLAELNRRSLSVVLDVWENEPDIDRQLLDKVNIGTPHIAGYSLEGKERGTFIVYRALNDFLNASFSESIFPESIVTERAVSKQKQAFLSNDITTLSLKTDNLNHLLLTCYDIQEDDKRLRQDDRFDLLRKHYISRREYSHFALSTHCETSSLRDTFALIKGES